MSQISKEENMGKCTVLVSVIVAIYKVEDYLEQCIQTILDQTYRNIEVILVDDGSPDRCSAICDDFQKRDDRIRVVHKNNEGSVYARRTGLLEAKGKYVLMVDGDDYMDPQYIHNLVIEAEEDTADVVVDSFFVSFPDKEYVEKIYHKVGTYRGQNLTEIKKSIIYAGEYFKFGINPALWNKLFRRDKLLKCYQDVPKQLTLGDDFSVSVPFMVSAECISIIDSNAYYHYRQRENSMVRAYDPKLIQKVENLLVYLTKIDVLLPYQEQLNYYYSWLLMSCLKNDALATKSVSELAQTIEQSNKCLSNVICIDELHNLGVKYEFIYTLIKQKLWRGLAVFLKLRRHK